MRDFDNAMQAIIDAGETDARGHLLIMLSKEYDLSLKEHEKACDLIASWINSSNDHTRHGVMFALCFYQPMRRYSSVAITGWLKAPIFELHFYSSAVESTYTDANMIDLAILTAPMKRYYETEKRMPQASVTTDTLASKDYAWEMNTTIEQAMRIYIHIASLLALKLECEGNIDGIHCNDRNDTMNWQYIANVLYHVLNKLKI